MFNFFGKSDAQIQTDVMNELKWDPSVNMAAVTSTTDNGIVTLRGTVSHFWDKTLAEGAAQRVGGVRAVADEIVVEITGPHEKSDEEIAEAALNALKWNYAVPNDIMVSVDKAWVTLRGEVEWDYERNAARNAVSRLIGVKGVLNAITIKPSVKAEDVQSQIEAALKRSAEVEGRKIKVTVSGSHVTLTGDVHSFSEIGDAGLAAWNAPGVTRVENELKLKH